MKTMWNSELTNIKSLGQTTQRPGSLAGLSEARKKHLSQFFTPKPVVSLVWQVLDALAPKSDGKITLFDNSIGIGSMVWPANPAKHRILGCDVHQPSVDALRECLSRAKFIYDVELGGMQHCEPNGFVHFSLINPPFSIGLESPQLKPYKCTSYGKYGPHTSAISHKYAIEQAKDHAHVTIAVLPTGFIDELIKDGCRDLRAIYTLPIDAFKDQGVHWPTGVCVFSKGPKGFVTETIGDDYVVNQMPTIDHWPENIDSKAHMNSCGFDEGLVTIPHNYTGDNTVRITHNGRKINLHYRCGLTMAKVENALMKEKASAVLDQRLPKGVKFSGQGCLDVELHLLQGDALASIHDNLVNPIEQAGGRVVMGQGFIDYISKKAKKLARIKEPFRQVVLSNGGSSMASVKARAIEDVLVDPSSLVSPVVDAGAEVELHNKNGQFYFIDETGEFLIDEGRLHKEFEMQTQGESWVVKHEGKAAAFPELAKMYQARIRAMKIDQWLTRDFQLDDLIEFMIQPCGSVCAWDMGLGKTRGILACIMLSEVKHGLVVLKPSLIGEFMRQIKEDLVDYISMDDVNVIIEPEDLDNLKQFNFISSLMLNRVINEKQSKNVTYSHRLRRRCGMVICDEGHFLSNMHTGQSAGVKRLSPKKLIVMSGTVIANYPRNIHPILSLCGGDGTAGQPWGYHYGRLEPELMQSMNVALCGPKAFKDAFVTVEWCTREFDGQLKGAKREIPRLSNVATYREMVTPFIKRRLKEEPDVTKYINIPVFTQKNEFLEWDFDHLAHYVKVSRKFAQVWKQAHIDKKPLSALLPRIQAVVKAANCPHIPVKGIGSYTGTTPKEIRTLELVKKWSESGEQTIVFAYSPESVKRLGRMLNDAGILTACIHSGKSIAARNEIIAAFKSQETMVLVASIGTLSEGHNLENASKIVMVNRSWSYKTESQCYSRVLRPLQKKHVEIVYLHYAGSICEYQRQMVINKADAAKVGIDYASAECFGEFLHMDRILADFVNDLPELEQQLINELAA